MPNFWGPGTSPSQTPKNDSILQFLQVLEFIRTGRKQFNSSQRISGLPIFRKLLLSVFALAVVTLSLGRRTLSRKRLLNQHFSSVRP
ncbi:uncharacterized protein LOC111526523 isoform X5 [Piliocolobus tephrosceles]|uniref:uncharacterized protein LOC111526523 isoform X5 n=1 Tax=Piliocolobus tephrosceles TaxID=591936 RepID=UPI000C2B2FDF|nr:uncharacterized protein LOC111526523 isoform X5 [Piliocolobus tephrosceles]XP_023048040.1 uncharacterized protein LOC111526523 isoform X5 [Piliocolobus tephrosceles]XP_023048041.1 uncharacterized protein LOC111526523 isoform X5 [Piliocolobus tephrosceles]XP_023048042.1 uncharacterized protein LOC111526523 isoform X5 [Piliocolobus tephrosceles]XP_023048043.1 uncharacterized protein LOC111526523 isoform X5 [Piliocolobus tephrosceles]